ncbi:MAG: TerB family tellurite resistance protein [Hyphomonas sp.]
MSELIEGASELFAPVITEKKQPFSLKQLVSEFPNNQSDWTLPEAFFCLVLSAALADGKIAQQESEELRALSHRSRILRNLDPNEMAALNRTVVKRRADRPDWLGEACRALPHDMHLSVFVHCLDLCLADGAMVLPEADFLESLLEHLAVSEEDARQATRILSVKNRY